MYTVSYFGLPLKILKKCGYDNDVSMSMRAARCRIFSMFLILSFLYMSHTVAAYSNFGLAYRVYLIFQMIKGSIV